MSKNKAMVDQLFRMADKKDDEGFTQADSDEIKKMVDTLRETADMIENDAKSVKGLCFISQYKHKEGFLTNVHVVGSPYFVAGSHLFLEYYGEAALERVIPEVMSEAFREMVDKFTDSEEQPRPETHSAPPTTH